MNGIKETGGALDPEDRVTLFVTGGSGNTPDSEVHITVKNDRGVIVIQGWFKSIELRSEIDAAETRVQRLNEPRMAA